jgi:hypothetical protein
VILLHVFDAVEVFRNTALVYGRVIALKCKMQAFGSMWRDIGVAVPTALDRVFRRIWD